MRHFPYCGMLLLEAGLPPPTTYAGPGSDRCCLCKRTLGRYTNLEVQQTSDGSEICEWCINRRWLTPAQRRLPRYSEMTKLDHANAEEVSLLAKYLDDIRAAA